MATHSGVLARRIPGTGEPGGLPSMGLHTAGHDWSDLAAATAAAHLGAQKWPVMATLDCLYVYFVKLALSSGNSLWSHKELNRTEHVCIHTHTHTHTHTHWEKVSTWVFQLYSPWLVTCINQTEFTKPDHPKLRNLLASESGVAFCFWGSSAIHFAVFQVFSERCQELF